MKFTYRLILFLFTALLGLSTIGYLFYSQEIVFFKPTPVPAGFKQVAIGSKVDLISQLPEVSGKKVFLHFFNPKCQCSKFNVSEFRELVHRYRDSLTFYVVMQNASQEDLEKFRHKYELSVPVILDRENQISEACGIYSTPQAVILTEYSEIYYKGNYNKARFCDSPESAFARKAVQCFLQGKVLPSFSEIATTPYGCQIPQVN